MKYVALVDDEDYEMLNKYNWSTFFNGKRVYAHCVIDGVHIQMHRLIMNAQKGQLIDHKDMDGLNNQKSNLRFCTQSENCVNIESRGRSKYYGVSYSLGRHPYTNIDGTIHFTECSKKWVARVLISVGKRKSLGRFHTEEEAARAYDAAVKLYNLEFCKLNFPET